ncbi:Aminoglycoside 6-adenylyltransferase [Ureibacillus acetophenoni]
MMDLILKVAIDDERVRAVGMNGSRTNPNAPKDIFQDYDIVYFVTEMDSFLREHNWIDIFGERIIMQIPENSELFPPSLGGDFTYLMQFTDGNRIDLRLSLIEKTSLWLQEDRLAKVLLDKDGLFPKLPAPTDNEYWVKKPSKKIFEDCCNEFWWVSTYIAKGLWREELLYAYDHLKITRNMLLQMLEWKVGIETDFSLSIGKNAKYLSRYVDQKTWDELLKTYPIVDENEIWNALWAMTNLFDEVGEEVANHLQFSYPPFNTSKVKAYLEHVSKLPKDAREIY